MAKGKNNFNGNDYIDQLQWRAQHRRRVPIRFEPKWKYKIVHRFPEATPFDRVIQLVILIGVIPLAIYVFSSILTSDQLELPGKIFFCFIIGLIISIIFFAVRDGSKDDDNKHIDS